MISTAESRVRGAAPTPGQCPRSQLKSRDLRLEPAPVRPHERVPPLHAPARRLKHAIALVLVGPERRDDRLLAHHPLPFHDRLLAVRILDQPVAGEQLHRALAHVLDPDVVAEDEPAQDRLRLRSQEPGPYRNADAVGELIEHV